MSEAHNDKLQYIKDNFDNKSISQLSRELGHTRATIRRWALELGLSKRKKYVSEPNVKECQLDYPYEGYVITEKGEVFEKDRRYIVAKRKNRYGYWRLTIVGSDGKSRDLLLHRLLAECFIPNKEGKEQVNHIDGDKANYSLDNLEWVTPKENSEHASETGLLTVGSSRAGTKITEEDAMFIKKKIREGVSTAEIVRNSNGKYTRSIVQKIKYGITWKHVM